MYLSLNIKYLRKVKKLKQGQLGELLGTTAKNIGNYEQEKANPPIEIMIKMADILGITVKDFVMKDLNNTDFNSLQTNSYKASSNFQGDNSNLFIPIRVQAGYVSEHSQESQDDYEQINLPGIKGDSRTFEISGDSMYPYFMHGDFVACLKVEHIREIKADKMYVVVLNTGITIKFVTIFNQEIFLRSTNEDIYPTTNHHLTEVREIWEAKIRITKHLIAPDSENKEMLKTVTGNMQTLQNRMNIIEQEIKSISKIAKS